MLPKNRVNLLLHECPRHLGALQWALVSAGTIGLQQGERLNWVVILHYNCNIHLISLVVSSSFKLSEVCTFGQNLTDCTLHNTGQTCIVLLRLLIPETTQTLHIHIHMKDANHQTQAVLGQVRNPQSRNQSVMNVIHSW